MDDDEEIRKMVSEALEWEGFLVEAVANGKQAIAAASKKMFDVTLVDVKLPDIDGIELLDQLKETANSKMIRIIITGYPNLKNAVGAVNKGADGYIFKPIDLWKLLKVIRDRLNERSNEYVNGQIRLHEKH